MRIFIFQWIFLKKSLKWMNREKKCKFRAHFEVEKKWGEIPRVPGRTDVRCLVFIYRNRMPEASGCVRGHIIKSSGSSLRLRVDSLVGYLFPAALPFFPTLRRPADGQKNKVEPTKKSRYPNRSTGLNPPSTTRGAGLGCSVSSLFLKKYKLLFRFKDNLMGRVFRAQKVTQFQVA